MEAERPAAGEGLRRPQNGGKGRRTGLLKIFFGYAAGVGKTYAMLEAAHRALAAGVDVVAGYIEPHTRPETMALLEGLEVLPPKETEHNGIAWQEFDLDAALERRPQLILVDELAHSNARGCRHTKRYQDVQELLRAGINVYTTVNVQHLESINDVVASITGVTVSERIPDSVFDCADQVEVMDLEPADLLERLREGKIQAAQAMGHFFTEKNLAALREIALRRTADRLERRPAALEDARARAGEHIMICLSGAPSNAKVIRTAARMAEAFRGSFTALFVETPDFAVQTEEERQQLRRNLRLAEQLGARITTAYGDDPAIQIAEYARVSGVTKIVLGRSPRQKSLLHRTKNLIDRLNELAPDLDIYIIPDQSNPPQQRREKLFRFSQERFTVKDTVKMLAVLTLCTATGILFRRLGMRDADTIIVYILGVLVTSMLTRGRSYSLAASLLSVLIFNFFFTSPYYTLLSDPSYLATFVIMFIVGLLGSSLTTRVKQQAVQSAHKAYRTEILLETSQKLQKAEGIPAILEVTATQLGRLLGRDVILYPVIGERALGSPMRFPVREGDDLSAYLVPEEQAVAQWVCGNNKHAGATTDTLPGAKCLYLAVRGSEQVEAVAAIVRDRERPADAFEKSMMVSILDECGLALEKERVLQAKRQVEEAARQEALRGDLLRAISHDLRTPLTSISGNAGILLEGGELDEDTKRRLYASIYDDALWLINLVENLLSITRMENGAMKLHIQPELLEEVFAEALNHLDRNAALHKIQVRQEDDLLMADMDARLIVQVMINMVNNAVKYTPEGSHITLSATRLDDKVEVTVADDGPGIPDEDKGRLFEMFYTAQKGRGDGRRGLGLGLSLCKSIITAHGGTITVEDNVPRGTCFRFTLHASEVTIHE